MAVSSFAFCFATSGDGLTAAVDTLVFVVMLFVEVTMLDVVVFSTLLPLSFNSSFFSFWTDKFEPNNHHHHPLVMYALATK